MISFVKYCTVNMDMFENYVKLNVLPLGSYDMLIGIDWIEQHRVVLNYFDKTFTCVNNEGEIVSVRVIPRKIAIRQISALKLKRVVWKGCKAFVVTIINKEHTNNEIH